MSEDRTSLPSCSSSSCSAPVWTIVLYHPHLCTLSCPRTVLGRSGRPESRESHSRAKTATNVSLYWPGWCWGSDMVGSEDDPIQSPVSMTQSACGRWRCDQTGGCPHHEVSLEVDWRSSLLDPHSPGHAQNSNIYKQNRIKEQNLTSSKVTILQFEESSLTKKIRK